MPQAKGRQKKNRIELELPSSWAETSIWMDWPEVTYAGRYLAKLGEKIRLEDLPETRLPQKIGE